MNDKRYQSSFDPKAIGICSEAAVLATMICSGYTILIPFGDNERFDLVTYKEGSYCRIQVKTAHIANGCIIASTTSTTSKHNGRRYTEDEIDAFAFYCPENGGVYFVPLDIVGARKEIRLRIEKTKNNQKKGVRWAKDFQL